MKNNYVKKINMQYVSRVKINLENLTDSDWKITSIMAQK